MRKVVVNHGSINYQIEVVDSDDVLKGGNNMQEVTLNKVKGYRNMIGMSQAEMADALGIKERVTYVNKENGKVKFTVDELSKLRDIFVSKGIQCTLDELSNFILS